MCCEYTFLAAGDQFQRSQHFGSVVKCMLYLIRCTHGLNLHLCLVFSSHMVAVADILFAFGCEIRLF